MTTTPAPEPSEREALDLARAITASIRGRSWASLSPLDHARTALAWFATRPAPEPSEREALALPPGWEYEDGCWMVAVTLFADNGPARVRVNGQPVWQGHVDETSGEVVDDRPLATRPAPVVSAEVVERAVDAVLATPVDPMGDPRATARGDVLTVLSALGITVADTTAEDDQDACECPSCVHYRAVNAQAVASPAADDEGGQDR